jgi:GGDEF domain-containing protein
VSYPQICYGYYAQHNKQHKDNQGNKATLICLYFFHIMLIIAQTEHFVQVKVVWLTRRAYYRTNFDFLMFFVLNISMSDKSRPQDEGSEDQHPADGDSGMTASSMDQGDRPSEPDDAPTALDEARTSGRLEARVEGLSDPLTGLSNREAFDRRARTVIDMLEQGEKAALIAFDLDGFKSVNDRLGHAAGDEVLQGVARTLEQELREADAWSLAGRLGGDEFEVIAPFRPQPDGKENDTNQADTNPQRRNQELSADDRANALISRLDVRFQDWFRGWIAEKQPGVDEADRLKVGLSAGYVLANRGDNLADLKQTADRLLQANKELRKSGLYSPAEIVFITSMMSAEMEGSGKRLIDLLGRAARMDVFHNLIADAAKDENS